MRLDVNFIDIAPISHTARDSPNLIAADGLHFSAEMYNLWIEQLLQLALIVLLVMASWSVWSLEAAFGLFV